MQSWAKNRVDVGYVPHTIFRENISILGDAINELSNSSPAKASDIVNALGRVGGIAKKFGLSELAAASLSNAFISLGKRPEVAGTAINGMLTKLMTADKQGKKFQLPSLL